MTTKVASIELIDPKRSSLLTAKVVSWPMRALHLIHKSTNQWRPGTFAICKCRHFSFLCRKLGLPCSASALITSFVHHQPFFIFAEPGDIWIDIRLSTPVRTYVLARRECPDLDAQSVPAGLAENFPHGLYFRCTGFCMLGIVIPSGSGDVE